MKNLLKKILGPDLISAIRHVRSKMNAYMAALQTRKIVLRNKLLGYSFLNIGAGRESEMAGWWTGDYQTGFVIDEHTQLPFKSNSIEFAYSSMFFEHIYDETARNLFSEIHRVLKPGRVLRIVVPDFHRYIQKYHEHDLNYFLRNSNNENFPTWERMGVPFDLEHLMAGMISSIHNLPHITVSLPEQEDFTKSPPHVYGVGFQTRYPGYYCGPAPELTTDTIREKLEQLQPEEFIDWVLSETNKSSYQDRSFNSWHKNHWDLDKLKKFSVAAGFSRVEISQYGDSPIALDERIEKPYHVDIGLYFNLHK